jgi:hypothetical protein
MCSIGLRPTADGPTQALFHADFEGAADQSGLHWGRFMDDGISCMDYDRCNWDDNHDGTFNRFNSRADETSPIRAKWFGYHTHRGGLQAVKATGVRFLPRQANIRRDSRSAIDAVDGSSAGA